MNRDDLNNRDLLLREKAVMDDGSSEWGVSYHETIPHETWMDFRDYDPMYYGMSADEHYADCKWPKNPLKLDTDDY